MQKYKIIYWWKVLKVKKQYREIAKDIKKLEKELEEISKKISHLSGGSSDPLPAGSELVTTIKKENHVANIS